MKLIERQRSTEHNGMKEYVGPIESAELKGYEDRKTIQKKILGKYLTKSLFKVNAITEKVMGLNKLNKNLQKDSESFFRENDYKIEPSYSLELRDGTLYDPFKSESEWLNELNDDFWHPKDLDDEHLGTSADKTDLGYGPTYNFSQKKNEKDMDPKSLIELQNEAELSYDIHVDPADDNEPLSLAELIERMEVDHSVKSAPHFADQIQDASRTNEITYINGKVIGLGTVTSERDYMEQRKTLTEHEVLTKTDEFLQSSINYLEGEGNPYLNRCISIAKSIRENLTFIGEKEYKEATKGIAEYWKGLLDHNPNQQILVLAGEIAKRYGSGGNFVKSDEYMLDNILSHFSDEEVEKYKGRLIVDLKDITAKDAVNLKIVLLDDWTISGSQLRAVANGIKSEYPQFKSSIEIQLIAASDRRITRGFSWDGSLRSPDRSSLSIPVRAYYRAHHSNDASNSETHITGFHSSVDYDFENDISNILSTIDYDGKAVKPQIVQHMPPMTNIVRPYRSNGFMLTYSNRFKLNKATYKVPVASHNSAVNYYHEYDEDSDLGFEGEE